MSNYAYAWVIVILAGLGGAYGLHRLLPGLNWLSKAPLLASVFAFFVAPAPVPRFDGQIAPAFVVFIFELLFQAQGEPGVAGGALLVCVTLAGLIAWLGASVWSRRTSASSAPGER